jgi:Ser/Thr protein kinase RdoA (MazF antagonist)
MSGIANSHGLDGTLVEPDWPPLTFDEVRALLLQYPRLGKATQLLSVSPRPFSAASVVATQKQRVFIKRHDWTVRDAEGLREEHRFMTHLRARGAAVPRVFATASSQTVVETLDWSYEVHETPQGVDLYQDALSWTPFRSVKHAHSAGRMLASLHQASEGFGSPARKSRPLTAGFTIYAATHPSAEFDRYLATRPALREYFKIRDCRDEVLALLAPFHAQLFPLLPALPPLWTHNDFHASNLLWSDDGPDASAVAVIDFGLSDLTNAVHDLAHAIERNIVGWLALVEDPVHPAEVPIHFDHLFALLDGYETVRPLSREESSALAPMTALCHAEFALSETGYFLSVLHSEDKARMACEGYLVAHARWFHGAGKRLLDVLSTWAATRGARAR